MHKDFYEAPVVAIEFQITLYSTWHVVQDDVNMSDERDQEENIRTHYAFHSMAYFSIAASNLILLNPRFPRLFQLTPILRALPFSFLWESYPLLLFCSSCFSRRLYLLLARSNIVVAFLPILTHEQSCLGCSVFGDSLKLPVIHYCVSIIFSCKVSYVKIYT